MLILPRAAVRAYRAVLRQCFPPRSRSPAAPILVHADAETISLFVSTGDFALRRTIPNAGGQATLLLPSALLGEIDGTTGNIEFVPQGQGKTVARWSDRNGSHERVFESLPEKATPWPPLPDQWGECPASLLVALHEAGRLASREPSRTATHRIQIRGEHGHVIGTDGRHALIQNGFALPFAVTVLIPALPVFTHREFEGMEARIGRTDRHLVLAIGPWTIWLGLDGNARYPNVDAVVPKSRGATVVNLSDADAALLVERLPSLPGHDRNAAPITLDIGESALVVRGRGSEETSIEIILNGSSATGAPVRLALDRRHLLRALALGCRRLRWIEAGRPWSALAHGKIYVAGSLDPSEIVGPSEAGTPSELVPVTATLQTRSVEPSGDLRDEAEGLRHSLRESGQRAGRLFARIANRIREERILDRLWTALKSLPPGGGPSR